MIKHLLITVFMQNIFPIVSTMSNIFGYEYSFKNRDLFLEGLRIYNKKDPTKKELEVLEKCEAQFDYEYQKSEKEFWEINDLKITFEIKDIYPGSIFEDTCLSEVIFISNSIYCFPRYSKVLMEDNTYENIEDLQVGDKVLSYDEKTKNFFEDEIVSLRYAMHNNYIEYDFGDKKIVATDDHPFLSTKGFVSLSPNSSKKYKGYETIEKIEIGDVLIFNDENRKLKNIKVLNKKEVGYTITKLKEGNTFIVEGAVVGVETNRAK